MPIGILINCGGVLIGGIIGSLMKKIIPTKLHESLPIIFGFTAILIGISKVVEVQNMTLVVLSLIIGTIIGELCSLETIIANVANRVIVIVGKNQPITQESANLLSTAKLFFVSADWGYLGH